jgi:predicted O-methyltransferase YrrM
MGLFLRSKQLRMIPGLVLFLIITGSCQGQQNPYEGLNNEHMMDVLKNFPHKAARWNVPAEDGRLLYDLILENDYQRVLEVGTSNGYSALWMGFALKETGGRLITIEINEERAREARENIEKAGLSSVIEVRLNDAMDEIPRLNGTFDMIFLDADKSQYMDYFRYLDPMITVGGRVTAHNVSTMEYAMKGFLETLSDHPGYETRVVEVSRQGVLVAHKQSEKEAR